MEPRRNKPSKRDRRSAREAKRNGGHIVQFGWKNDRPLPSDPYEPSERGSTLELIKHANRKELRS